MVQAHIFYSGIVQGVGFRYTVFHLAQDLDLTGWVRNRSDGRVEVVVEGSKNQIEDFLSRLSNKFHQYIKTRDVQYYERKGEFSDFQIHPTF